MADKDEAAKASAEDDLNPEVPTFMVLAFRRAMGCRDAPSRDAFSKLARLSYWDGVIRCLEEEFAVINKEKSANEAVNDLALYINGMMEAAHAEDN